MLKNRKTEAHHWIPHIRISPDTKYQPKLTILIFWTRFAQKGFFWSKTKKVNITMEFCIFELFWVPNFSLNSQLSFWTNFTKKRYFQSKTEQAVQELQVSAFCVVNFNSTDVLEYFKDLKNLIILIILKEIIIGYLLLVFILKLYKAFQTALCK